MRMKTDSRERGHDAVEGVKDVVLIGSAPSGPVGKLAAQERMDPRANVVPQSHVLLDTNQPHGGGLERIRRATCLRCARSSLAGAARNCCVLMRNLG